MKTIALLFLFTSSSLLSNSQTIGGDAIYDFLHLAPAPQLSALGGINVSHPNKDLTLAYANPALLSDSMTGQISANFNILFADIKNYFLASAWHSSKIKTSFSASVNYLNYGRVPQTDASGNILGEFNAKDYVAELVASRQYEKNWNYGIALKYISSDYGIYRSSSLMMDFGMRYHGDNKKTSVGISAKNAGFLLKSYSNQKEDLPFDLQIGITQKLTVPVWVSVTAHRLHQFKMKYLVFAAQGFVTDKIDITVGYDNLKRIELKNGEGGNGVTGFSFGVGAHFNVIDVRYARGYYQSASAFNQIGINFRL